MSAVMVSRPVTTIPPNSSIVEVDSNCSSHAPAAETLWEPPSEEEFRQATRMLALRVIQYICGYGEESDVARSKHGSMESRLITAHEMLGQALRQTAYMIELIWRCETRPTRRAADVSGTDSA